MFEWLQGEVRLENKALASPVITHWSSIVCVRQESRSLGYTRYTRYAVPVSPAAPSHNSRKNDMLFNPSADDGLRTMDPVVSHVTSAQTCLVI